MTNLTTRPTPAGDTAVLFPEGFWWGAATAAYQIEGAVAEDGRTPSIWDTFTRVNGAVANGETGDVACDHYHRMPEDIALMSSLGLDAYRFSVAWPRVRPDGGGINRKGVDFYSRLVDTLLEHGIRPWLTLYHWDLPQALEDAGGWTNRDTAYRFAEYAATVHDALGDRVSVWTTLNEPWCSAFLGYTGGQHAPGRRDGAAGLVAAHHLLLAHGLAVAELRGAPNPPPNLGITLNLTVADPWDPEDELDRDAARRIDALHNRLLLDPLLRGRYPTDVLADTDHLTWQGQPWHAVVREGDLSLIHAPLEVLGVNYYKGDTVTGHAQSGGGGYAAGPTERVTSTPFVGCDDVTFLRRGLPLTEMGWEVQPEGLTRLLTRLATDYEPPPMFITENGAAYPDRRGDDGGVEDLDRVAYIDAHLRAVHAAIEQGVDVRGFFQWSLLDNFEWAYGYAKRFGIVYVDYPTLERVPKRSAFFLGEVAARNRLEASVDPSGLAGS